MTTLIRTKKNNAIFRCPLWLYTFVFATLISSCSNRHYLRKKLTTMQDTFQNHIGLFVYDPEHQKPILSFNHTKHFTPASNMKIFTLYAAVRLLGDSIPALQYVQREDSLIFWGTGDPSFLYDKVSHPSPVFDFLKNAPQPLYFLSPYRKMLRFGPGWAWDDYLYTFSSERSSFPIYANRVSFSSGQEQKIRATPSYFQPYLVPIANKKIANKIVRHPEINQFVFNVALSLLSDITFVLPFRTDPLLTAHLLSDTLKRTVTHIKHLHSTNDVNTLYSIPAEETYRLMMQESDNFVAEQLLLTCGQILSDTLEQSIAIRYMMENYLADLPDEVRWVDGSGLSRYNLATPQSIVYVLEKIDQYVPRKKLFQWFALGGESGTLKDKFRHDPPYLYAKTGSLTSVYCLSGYLITKKNKTLLFSFMNNDYTVPLKKIHPTMEAILEEIHNRL